ncbi:MAG TPA: CapA family protein [Candidatus Angelobacter sp.]|nr:CapA family protein [Candidatus Angelobacter sp.]
MMLISAGATNLSSLHLQAEEKTAELWLGGDVNLGDGGRGQLDSISGIVQGAAGIVNLEGPVAGHRQLKAHGLRLWNAPSALKEISALNVKVAGIANNHSADAGPLGAQRTAQQLLAHGIFPAGKPGGAVIEQVNGLVIAVAAYDLTHGVPVNLAQELATAKRLAIVAGLVRPVNVLIVTFHVTGPPSYLPRPELKRAVEIAYQAGAQIIVAHGTHALGPVERREHAVIAWGLGNVAFACDCTKEQDALLLRVRVTGDKVVSAEVVPIQAGLNLQPARPSQDADGIFDLLEAIGSSKLHRKGSVAKF